MIIRWIGIALIFCSASGIGFGAAMQSRRRQTQLQQLNDVLGILACDMRYAINALPSLCITAANVTTGPIRTLFLELSKALSIPLPPEAAMRMAIERTKSLNLPQSIVFCLLELGQSLGQFDVEGETAVIEQSRHRIATRLAELESQLPQRCKSYRALGLCAGAAIVILLL